LIVRVSKLEHYSGRDTDVPILCIPGKTRTDPIGLQESNSDPSAQTYIEASAQQHRKAGLRSAVR